MSHVVKCSDSRNMKSSCIGTADNKRNNLCTLFARAAGISSTTSSAVYLEAGDTRCIGMCKRSLEQEVRRRNAACVKVYHGQAHLLEDMQRPREICKGHDCLTGQQEHEEICPIMLGNASSPAQRSPSQGIEGGTREEEQRANERDASVREIETMEHETQ